MNRFAYRGLEPSAVRTHVRSTDSVNTGAIRLFALLATLLCITGPLWSRQGPTVTFDPPTYTVLEDAGTAFANLRLTGCGARQPKGTIEVRVTAEDGTALEGEDFFVFEQAKLGTVESTTKEGRATSSRVYRSVEVPIGLVHDDAVEEAESFRLRLELVGDKMLDCGSGPEEVRSGPPAGVTITDVPFDQSTVQFTKTEVFVTEGDGNEQRIAHFTVERLAGRMPISALCQTTRAGNATEYQDFEPINTVLGWGEDDQSQKTCAVVIASDDVTERSETVALTLKPLEGIVTVAVGEALITIADDDSPGRVQFTTTRFEVGANPTAVISLIRRGGSEGEATVRINVQAQGERSQRGFRSVSHSMTWAEGEEGIRELEVSLTDHQKRQSVRQLLLSLESDQPDALGDLRNAVLVVVEDRR